MSQVNEGNIPEREHLLVSVGEMNRRIAEAVERERETCVAIPQEAASELIGGKSRVNQVDRHGGIRAHKVRQ